MRLPVQASGIVREEFNWASDHGSSSSRSLSAAARPRSRSAFGCNHGEFCCPDAETCTHCCNMVTQNCVNGACQAKLGSSYGIVHFPA
jgi:hypothetical protein